LCWRFGFVDMFPMGFHVHRGPLPRRVSLPQLSSKRPADAGGRIVNPVSSLVSARLVMKQDKTKESRETSRLSNSLILFLHCRRFFDFLRRFSFEHHFAFRVHDDFDRVTVLEFTAQKLIGKWILHLLLDDPA
jgi:hypothetical protein